MTFVHPTITTMRMTRRTGPEGHQSRVLVVETGMDLPYTGRRTGGRQKQDSFKDLVLQISKLRASADSEYADFDAIEIKGPTWSAFANGAPDGNRVVSQA